MAPCDWCCSTAEALFWRADEESGALDRRVVWREVTAGAARKGNRAVVLVVKGIGLAGRS